MVEIKVNIDKTDRKILAKLDKNCRIPSTQLAKKVGKSRQAVEYRINQLVNKGIITSFNASINPHKIGYKAYKIYVKLRNIPKEKEKLFKYLRGSGRVYWMGECSGSWDLIFSFFAKNDYEFFELKNDFISKFSKIIVNEEDGILIDVKQYPKMYFTEKIEEPTIFAGEIVNNKLEKIDFLILEHIVNDGRISLVDLARKVKSTEIIVKNRLKKLKEKGIIIQYRIGVNFSKLGLELYKAIIRLDRYNKEDEKKLLKYISNLPNVQYFIRNISQIEPELVVNNYQEYYEIIENLKKEFPEVIRTVDTVLMITDEWTPGFGNLLKG
ncbi:MAG: winged helix-turn-helix transcriptional regulator [Nanoarchaeota archaeon]|nr:winged helix-turn-helix transcriptional regulator [Nanoarchaeota archaeon]